MIDDLIQELKEDMENLRIEYTDKLEDEARNIAELSPEERATEGRKLNEAMAILRGLQCR
jgi:hypothetical protein